MSLRRTARIALVIALSACLAGPPAVPAFGAPSVAQTAEDRARANEAYARYAAVRAKEAALDARVARVYAELDRVLAEEQAAYTRLETRAVAVYRSGDDALLEMLLGAESVEDFTQRWEMLARLSEQDAADLATLRTARTKAERSARSLLKLQSDQAKASDAAAGELASARKALANSTAALRDYEARVARAARAAKQAAARRKSAMQQRSGSGAWLTGNASHYSKDFTGRGASGRAITPYSMMVAHKTLPFHTLIEIEYKGRRCVASVEDRGPRSASRMFDLGPGVVRALGFSGVHPVRYRIIGR